MKFPWLHSPVSYPKPAAWVRKPGRRGTSSGQDVSLYYHGQGFRETGARVGVRVGVSVRVSVKLSFWVSFLVTHLYLRTALEDQVRFYKVR